MSPKYFTLALDYALKHFLWGHRGIDIEGENLQLLRFANYIRVFARSKEELTTLTQDIARAQQG